MELALDACLCEIANIKPVSRSRHLLQFISKVLLNIIKNPNETKYRSIAIKVVEKKLNDDQSLKCCKCLLKLSAFKSSGNRKRLLFTNDDISTLKLVYNKIKMKQKEIEASNVDQGAGFDFETEISTLIASGLTIDESIKAIKMSLNDNQVIDDNVVTQLTKSGQSMKKQLFEQENKEKQMDLDEAVKYLMNIGYTSDEAMNAFVAAKYDIKIAVLYLLNGYVPSINRNDYDISPLIGMGFNANDATLALQLSNGRQNVAAEYLLQQRIQCSHNCPLPIKACDHVNRLVRVLNKYKGLVNKYVKHTVRILNDYHHLLFCHHYDDHFEFIYNLCNKCDMSKCVIVTRHFRDRMLNDNYNNNIKDHNVYCNIMDTMHCHFVHSYDLKYRLNHNEKTQDDYKQNSSTNDILITKQRYIDYKSKFNQIKQANKYGQINEYSFGQRFYYWDYFKNCCQQDCVSSNKQFNMHQNLYINKKYGSFKEELCNNNIATLSVEQWDKEYNKSLINIATKYAKTLIAATCSHLFIAANTTLYGIRNGEMISTNQLIAVSIYCGYTYLSYKFSETYRNLIIPKFPGSCFSMVHRQNDIKQKHSNFYHLARYLNEAVHIFSKSVYDQNFNTVYHGIDKSMIFDSLRCRMYQPLSTTTQYEVALNFATKDKGMILSINPDTLSKCFDCGWISDFSNEKEFLFISCVYPMMFTDINILSGKCGSELHIKGITILDKICSGLAFNSNPKIRWDLSKRKPIDAIVKLKTIQLIKHQLHRYYPTKYSKIPKMNYYIQQLLNKICQSKQTLLFDYALMNVETTNSIRGVEGYQGYLFLKYLFCVKQCQMINLNIISLLYPNSYGVIIMNVTEFNSKSIDEIQNFISSNKSSKLCAIGIMLSKKMSLFNVTKAKKLLKDSKKKIELNGWTSMFIPKEVFGAMKGFSINTNMLQLLKTGFIHLC